MRKKAQHMMGLPFVFIIGIIIAAVIVIVAVMAIKSLSCRNDQVSVNLFIQDLRGDIEKMYYASEDSQMIFKGSIPGSCSKIESICFANPRNTKTEAQYNNEWNEIKRYDNNDNFFLYPRKTLTKISVAQEHNINRSLGIPVYFETNPLCFQTQGKIEIILQNKGDSVFIKK